MADWTAPGKFNLGYCHLRLKAYDVSLGHVSAKELVGGGRSTGTLLAWGQWIDDDTFPMKSFPDEFFWYVDTLDLIFFGRWDGQGRCDSWILLRQTEPTAAGCSWKRSTTCVNINIACVACVYLYIIEYHTCFLQKRQAHHHEPIVWQKHDIDKGGFTWLIRISKNLHCLDWVFGVEDW